MRADHRKRRRLEIVTIDLVHIGYGNYLSTGRIIAIATPGSAPTKRHVLSAKDKNLAIDLTNGHRVKSVVFTDTPYIVLAGLETVTIYKRITADMREGDANA